MATGRRNLAPILAIAGLVTLSGCNRSESDTDQRWLEDVQETHSEADAEEAPPGCVPDASTWPVEMSRLDSEIREASGVVQSRLDPNSLWIHNDSGDDAILYRVERDEGDIVQRVSLSGVDARDWEDIAAGDCPSSVPATDCLVVGDMGDNSAVHESIVVHVLEEPGPTQSAIGVDDVHTRTFVYEDGPRDAEALLWSDERVYVLTKGARGFDVYSAVWPAAQGLLPATLRHEGRVEFADVFPDAAGAGYVTAADISSDGRHVVLRTYGSIFVVGGAADADMLTRLSTAVAELRPGAEFQGEAIAFTHDGVVHVAEGESVPMWRIPCR